MIDTSYKGKLFFPWLEVSIEGKDQQRDPAAIHKPNYQHTAQPKKYLSFEPHILGQYKCQPEADNTKPYTLPSYNYSWSLRQGKRIITFHNSI